MHPSTKNEWQVLGGPVPKLDPNDTLEIVLVGENSLNLPADKLGSRIFTGNQLSKMIPKRPSYLGE